MSPKRIPKWVVRRIDESRLSVAANKRPFLASLALSTIVIMVFAFLLDQKDEHLESQDAKLEQLFACAQDYVEADNAATLPIREAAAQLDAADDRLWHAAQVVFTQSATSADYEELRMAVVDRNHLADELKEAREENPPPPPPRAFCENGADLVITSDVAGLGGTPGCATHGEWGDVKPFMRPWRIAEIIGNDGWFIQTPNPDTFARGYNLCWTTNFGKVWFDAQSDLSIRKDVV